MRTTWEGAQGGPFGRRETRSVWPFPGPPLRWVSQMWFASKIWHLVWSAFFWHHRGATRRPQDGHKRGKHPIGRPRIGTHQGKHQEERTNKKRDFGAPSLRTALSRTADPGGGCRVVKLPACRVQGCQGAGCEAAGQNFALLSAP